MRVGAGKLSQSTSSQRSRNQSEAQTLTRWSPLAANHKSVPSTPKSPYWGGKGGWVPPAPLCPIPLPCQHPPDGPLHLLARALDGGNRGPPVVTQHSEGHARAGAAHSHKPILVSGEDGLTWARQGPLYHPVSPQPPAQRCDLDQAEVPPSPCEPPAPHRRQRRRSPSVRLGGGAS